MASASITPRTSNTSVSTASVGATRTSRLKPLPNWLRRMASATAWCDAETHNPRPGSLRFRSGITSPEGATTNRISSSIGRTCRVTAHIRIVADLSVRGPLSRSGSAKASMGGTFSLHGLVFGGLGVLGLFDQIGLGDPAGDDARLHDHVLRVIARDFVGVENAGMLGRLAAFLALGPADQIVGGATGEILDRLDVVLAELDQHLRGHAGHRLQSIVHTELLAFVFQLGLELFQVFFRPVLQFVGGFVVKTLDACQFLDVDQREFLDRGKTFRR